MLTFDQLFELVKSRCVAGVTADTHSTPQAIRVDSSDLIKVCRELHQNSSTYFDMLSCVTAIDNGHEAGTMEVAYNLYSIPFHHHLALRVTLQREDPHIESVTSIWKTANWHEREAYDMFGIIFKNHPDLRRILMPADWEGFPLRKDYKNAESYRGITFDYLPGEGKIANDQ